MAKKFEDYDDFFENVAHTFSEDVKNAKNEILSVLEEIKTDNFAECCVFRFKLEENGCFLDDHIILQSTKKKYCNKVISKAIEKLTATKKVNYYPNSSPCSSYVGSLEFIPLI